MKKIHLLLALFIGFALISKAQVVRKGASETATIKTPTVQCDECKKRIESYVSREQGVQKVVVDYKKKITTVTYLWDRTSVENVKAAIANAGYDADDVTADPDAYKRLPICCKKTEDGGGHDSKKN
ncbi:MAG TPA: cation transporter [Puia sp.]|nr:cation transporter [Puia sp.]